jgi:uncharacterized membrane protein
MDWFSHRGIFFIPKSIIGWLIAIFCIVYLIYAFIQIDSTSHSVGDTMINWVFRSLIVGAIYSVVGFICSKN